MIREVTVIADVSNSKYLGKWKAYSVDVFKESGELNADTVLSLNADGKATMVSVDDVVEYKWWETESGVYLDSLGDKADLKFKADGPDTLKTRILFFYLKFKRIK